MDTLSSTRLVENPLGMVITFYSFKGGVGRSMALANVAVLLARTGKKVLCVDWDLEAPGLDRYFRAVPRSSPNLIPTLSEPTKCGGLLAILEASSMDTLDGWRDYVLTRTGFDGTRLDLMGSGDDDKDYPTRLSTFSWTEFFSRRNGGNVIEALRNKWKEVYDYVLIDSRTGLNDSSGVCTIQMPDLIVMLFAANEQNVDWSQRVARGIRNGRSELPYDRTFLPIIPLLSRFDAREESDRAGEAMDRIAQLFAPFFADWLPRAITARDMLAWSVLPYIPRYSFEEALAVEDEPASGAQGLSFYYQLLARIISEPFRDIRTILASVGVPGAALPPLLPSPTDLDLELRHDPKAVKRYRVKIAERAEEEPMEAVDAFEALSNAYIALGRLRGAEEMLDEAINILIDPSVASVASSDVLTLLKQKKSKISKLSPRRFRIALSFAEEKRDFVAKVAAILAKKFGEDKILYDKYQEAEFARKDLGVYLQKLYGEESDLIVLVLCPEYDHKRWSGWEWVHIYELLTTTDGHRVMLCRFDQASADGLSPASGFIELEHKTPAQAATLILERLALNEGKPKDHYTKDASGTVERANIPNNLPRLQFFFGRETELKKIADALAPDARGWGALIDGPGGIGKTAIAIRAAELVPADRFQRIIFLSSKERELTADGQRALGYFVLPSYLEMLNAIARELNQPELAKAPETERSDLILRALREADVLLLLDNLETLPEGDRDQLFTFLNRLPRGCSAIVTSRRRADASAVTVRLDKLDWPAARDLLAALATNNDRLARATEPERRALYDETGGNPLLMRWVAGQLGLGRCKTIAAALNFLRSAPAGNNPLEFIFGDLLDTFSPNETKILASLTYFTTLMPVKFIAELASLNEAAAQGALSDLSSRALVLPDLEERHFALVPMVADFLRRKRPEVVAETGNRLEQRAYALIVENGYEEHDRFLVLEAAWPTVAPALPLFLAGPNDRLQTVCDALTNFLDFTGRWDEWLLLSEQAEARAVAAGDHNNAGWRVKDVGYVHYLRQQADAVLDWADRAAAHFQAAQAGARERATVIQLRGLGHRLKRDYPAAIVAYRESLDLFLNVSTESVEVAILLNDLADVERYSSDFAAAERDYREALRVARAVVYVEGVASITGNLADLALDREDWPGAEALAHEALPLSEAVGHQQLVASNCQRIAKALVRQGNAAEALPYARRAVDIYTRLGSPDLAIAQATLWECEG